MNKLLLYLAVILFLGACSQLRVSTDYDPDVSVTLLHTYRVQEPQDIAFDTLHHERVVTAVQENLNAKGYREAEEGKADFHVRYRTEVLHDVPGNFSFGVGFGTFSGGSGMSLGTSSRPVQDEGVFLIDILNPKEGKIIWRGTVQGKMKRTATPAQREAEVRRFVDALLKEFPAQGR
jgi:hypothetical protein